MNHSKQTAAINKHVFSHPSAVHEYSSKKDLFPVELTVFHKWLPGLPGRVLDIGCGTGRTTAHLAAMGYEVVAGDYAEEMIIAAKKLHSALEFRILDATNLDLPSGSFDAVLFAWNGIDCIYPYSQRLRALGEIKRVLKAGGIFIYSSHNILGRFTRLKNSLREWLSYHGYFIKASFGLQLLQNYWKEKHHETWLTIYCGIPLRQILALKNAGFEFLAVESEYSDSVWRATLGDYWPHYISRKPVAQW
jgi:SAM-dependent methyltransferase